MDSVVVSLCETYEVELISKAIKKIILNLGIDADFFKNKKVVIKPNLVSARAPEKAATTHPSFIEALGCILKEYQPQSIVIAESSGGPYTSASLNALYHTCKIYEAAEKAELPLNFDTGFQTLSCPEGKRIHEFLSINPVAEADIIIDLCKLKTHTLTLMTCATKNFFGTIPGRHKFELHSRFPSQPDFQNMIVDLGEYYYKTKKIICICDAIECMEGNGPTNGTSRHIGVLLGSTSPFHLDIVAEHLLGFDGQVPMCDIMYERGLTPRSFHQIQLLGDSLEKIVQSNWAKPDSNPKGLLFFFLNNFKNVCGGRIVRSFSPHPIVNKQKCVACGKCIESCPQNTIQFKTKGNKKIAFVDTSNCIRCFCCQELCPFNAIDIKSNPIISLIH